MFRNEENDTLFHKTRRSTLQTDVLKTTDKSTRARKQDLKKLKGGRVRVGVSNADASKIVTRNSITVPPSSDHSPRKTQM